MHRKARTQDNPNWTNFPRPLYPSWFSSKTEIILHKSSAHTQAHPDESRWETHRGIGQEGNILFWIEYVIHLLQSAALTRTRTKGWNNEHLLIWIALPFNLELEGSTDRPMSDDPLNCVCLEMTDGVSLKQNTYTVASVTDIFPHFTTFDMWQGQHLTTYLKNQNPFRGLRSHSSQSWFKIHILARFQHKNGWHRYVNDKSTWISKCSTAFQYC